MLVSVVLSSATWSGAYSLFLVWMIVEYVLTVERDVAAPGLARLNSWPAELFTNPGTGQIVCNLTQETEGFEDGSFSHVIHDPPTIVLTGELYSGDFYRELCRVLSEAKGEVVSLHGGPKEQARAEHGQGRGTKVARGGLGQSEVCG